MTSQQIQQLTELRDAFRRDRSHLESTSVKDYMDRYLHDTMLKKLLVDDVSAKAVWYCLCNNNADRSVLIGKLYNYFVNKNKSNSALGLISIALFLCGVDFQLNQIERPEQQNWSSSSPNSLNYSGSGGVKKGSRTPSTMINKHKWVLGLAMLVTVVLIVVAVSKSGKDNHRSRYSKTDLCRIYEGTIQKEDDKGTYRLSVSLDFEVTVSNKSKLDDKRTYSAQLRDDELRLKHGPNLKIDRNEQRKIKLFYEDKKNLEKWDFVAQ